MRRYLLALLWHDNVPQSALCEVGPLWTNCDGERADVFDHETHQIFENADDAYNLRPKCVAVLFNFESVNRVLSPTRVERTEIRLVIDIVCHDASGRLRQEILDQVEERILYRLLSYQEFTDAGTGEVLKSFMRWSDGNELRIDSRDNSAFEGNYTIRQLSIGLTTRDCVARPPCNDVALCFDFSDLTVLDENC